MANTKSTARQILVVEDSYGDAQMIREVFGDLPHVQWHFVQSVVEARDFLFNQPPYHATPRPDLVILDVSLPVSPGYHFIPEIKTNPAYSDIHVVVFTASTSAHDRAMCAELGADAYILKPMALSDWTSALTAVLHDHLPASAEPQSGIGVP